MNFGRQSFLGAGLAAATLLVALAPAQAQAGAAAHVQAPLTSPLVALAQPAQYRGREGYRGGDGYRRRGGDGAGIALGVGAAIIGGILLSETATAEHRRSHGGDWNRCANTYRSFEPNTGMYTGYDGVRRTCPYLN